MVDRTGAPPIPGVLRERLAALSPELAAGFHVRDIDAVYRDMHDLRSRLERSLP